METFPKVVEMRRNLPEFDGLYKLYEMTKEIVTSKSTKNESL
jgi:hypothetical protein